MSVSDGSARTDLRDCGSRQNALHPGKTETSHKPGQHAYSHRSSAVAISSTVRVLDTSIGLFLYERQLMKLVDRSGELVAFHKALASRSRLRIVSLLAGRSLCVGALARSLRISQPAVSQHLEVLRNARLVVGERSGVMIHYRLNTEQVKRLGGATVALLGE